MAALVVGAVLLGTTGSHVPTVVAVAGAVAGVAWLHALLAEDIADAPAAPVAARGEPAGAAPARIAAVRSLLDRAITRPEYERTLRPLLAGLATQRLSGRGIDPSTEPGRAAAAHALGAAAAAYLFPDETRPPPALSAPLLDDVLTRIEDL